LRVLKNPRPHAVSIRPGLKIFWLILAGVALAAAIPTAVLISSRAYAPAALTFALSIGVGLFIARRVSRPLRQFDSAAMDIARGKFGIQVPVPAGHELGELAKTFNYMSAQIEAYTYETSRLYEDIESCYLETMVALANSIDSKDSYTRGHSQRVADMSVEIGKEL